MHTPIGSCSTPSQVDSSLFRITGRAHEEKAVVDYQQYCRGRTNLINLVQQSPLPHFRLIVLPVPTEFMVVAALHPTLVAVAEPWLGA